METRSRKGKHQEEEESSKPPKAGRGHHHHSFGLGARESVPHPLAGGPLINRFLPVSIAARIRFNSPTHPNPSSAYFLRHLRLLELLAMAAAALREQLNAHIASMYASVSLVFPSCTAWLDG